MQDNTEQTIAQAFKALNHDEQTKIDSNTGIYASWIALGILLLCFIYVAYFIGDADRNSEKQRLEQSTNLIVQTLETRLSDTNSALQKTSMRLLRSDINHFSLSRMAPSAAAFMLEHPDIHELTLVDRSLNVVSSWGTSYTGNDLTRRPNSTINDPALLNSIKKTFVLDNSSYTFPYTLSKRGTIFIDLVVPTPLGKHALVARLNLSRLITESVLTLGFEEYQFKVLVNKKPLIPTQDNIELLSGTYHLTPITSLSKNIELYARNNKVSSLYSDNLKAWTILGLMASLSAALIMLLHYQQRQVVAHHKLMAEFALRRSISESQLAGVRVTDPSGRIVFVNKTFEKMTGYSAKELVGTTAPFSYWTGNPLDLHQHFYYLHSKESDKNRLYPHRFTIRKKDGELIEAELYASPLKNEKGKYLGWIASCYNISPFTRVVESMNSAIAVISIPEKNHSPELLLANEPYRKLLGDSAEGLLRLKHLIEKTTSTNIRKGVFDETTQRWFDARVQQIYWSSGNPVLMLIALDITEQRRMELALEEQIKKSEHSARLVAMGEMASSLAHELNQPLAAISNYATGAGMMIAAGKLTQEDTLGAFNKVLNQSQRAAAIIKRIRSFAKRADPQFLEVSVNTIVEETMELALIQADKLNASIVTKIEDELPKIIGDAVMLEQLLLNLLKNAMEAVEPFENHEITLNIKQLPEEGMLEFLVIDHGPGIPPEMKEQLYHAFFSTKQEGMGMGLNICRSIVELHHGRIVILDTPGGGTTFRFTIPFAKEST